MCGPSLAERSERQPAADGNTCSRLTSRRSPVRAGHRPSSRPLPTRECWIAAGGWTASRFAPLVRKDGMKRGLRRSARETRAKWQLPELEEAPVAIVAGFDVH